MDARKLFKVFLSFLIVSLELFDDVRADIRVHFLDPLCHIQTVFGRYCALAITQELLHKVRNVAAGDRNMLDG